jgi:hypothetical protein
MELQEPYYCECCKYTTKYRASWMHHLDTIKHKNGGKRPVKNPMNLDSNCKHCNYTSENLLNMTVHTLTNHSTSEERRARFKYYCEICDIGAVSENAFLRHCDTKKHKFRL